MEKEKLTEKEKMLAGMLYDADHDEELVQDRIRAKVKFGDNVMIAPTCGFYTAGHPTDAGLRSQALEYTYPITVGNPAKVIKTLDAEKFRKEPSDLQE